MADKPRCLLVDDMTDILDLIKQVMEDENFSCHTATSLDEAKSLLVNCEFNFCITDNKMAGDNDGINLIKHIQQYYPIIPVAMISAHGNIKKAVEVMQMGAMDFIERETSFIQKPIDNRKIKELAKKVYKLWERRNNAKHQLIGESKQIQELRKKIENIPKDDSLPVYILGETGTGKEVVANLIHQSSDRADKPFIPINCGAISSELIESELFGHKRGSFTGAATDKKGLFLAANQGTLFLDEVADLPMSLQSKLLRALQEKKIRPIGGEKEIPIDVRVISATHSDLRRMVDEGKFRQDLYYRINSGDELLIPPLRERLEDIELLAKHILSVEDPDDKVEISNQAIVFLQEYSFPGNVRELQTILIRARRICKDSVISAEDIGKVCPNIQIAKSVNVARLYSTASSFQLDVQSEDSLSLSLPEDDSLNLDKKMELFEKQEIIKALKQTRGNKTKAAELLGLEYGALRFRIDKYKINSSEFK